MSRVEHKIALYGLYGWGSLGDAAVQEAVIAFLRRNRPDAQIYCICPNPADAEQRFGVPAFPITRIPKKPWPGLDNPILKVLYRTFVRIPLEVEVALQPFRHLRGFDMLVISGGGQVTDYGVSAFRYPWNLYKWSLAARVDGADVEVLSVGAGPLREWLSRRLVARALKRASFRSYRDQGSRDFLVSIGLPYAKDPITPDMAFGLPISPEQRSLAHDHDQSARDGSRRTVVGVTAMSYCDPRGWSIHDQARYDLYLQRLTDFTAWLIEHGYGVRYLVGDVWNDRRTIEDIEAGLEERGVHTEPGQMIAAPIYGVADLLAEVAQVDIVVSSRFHVIVFGLLFHRPAISIAYNQKSDSIMRSFGLQDYCHQIDDFDPALLESQIERLEQERFDHIPTIERTVNEYRDRVETLLRQVFCGEGAQDAAGVEPDSGVAEPQDGMLATRAN